ncbi:hypothetical protein QE152_g6810 [Popillia japonica]|uniref:Uncharacterized protein n=1 Tax=Popillia japonica TaxID=7064 RepID=A0AAW1MDF7_POPJA
MPADNIDRITRSSSEKDEALIQKIIERVLINPVFLEKLSSAIAEKIACQDKQIKVCEEKVVSLERKVEDLHSELECQQQYSRRNNLRIFGIPLTKDEDTGNVVTKMVKEKLNITLTANDIDWCHRLKQKKHNLRFEIKIKRFQDHYLIYVQLDFGACLSIPRTHTFRDFSRFNVANFTDDLLSISWDSVYCMADINDKFYR